MHTFAGIYVDMKVTESSTLAHTRLYAQSLGSSFEFFNICSLYFPITEVIVMVNDSMRGTVDFYLGLVDSDFVQISKYRRDFFQWQSPSVWKIKPNDDTADEGENDR